MNDGEGISCAPEVSNITTSTPEDSTGLTNLPSGSAQELAQQIIDSDNITIAPQYETHVRNISNGDNSCPLNKDILGIILAISEDFKINISSLNRSCTGNTAGAGTASKHWQGKAVDIASINGVATTGRDSDAISVIKKISPLLPSGSGIGQKQCGATPELADGITTFNDSCDHLHIQVP